jgi:hypothetical protein
MRGIGQARKDVGAVGFRRWHRRDWNPESGGAGAVSRRIQISVAVIAMATIGVSLGLLAMLRIREAKEFNQPHIVQTYGGTNYVVQLTEAAVGKTETGCVLIVYLRLQNPNAYDVTLRRNWFILIDHDKNYFLPSTTGTQTELIKLPANSVLDREMLSFLVPDNTFAGRVALFVGQNYMVLVKNEGPFEADLRNGEFRSFRRRSW